MAGHAAGDRMDAELHVDAALGERVVEFADLVLRLRDGHAVAGDDDDLAGGGENAGGFFGRGAATGRASSRLPAAAVCDWPNPPKSTLVKERFIAFDMMTERMKPGRAVERAGDDEQLAVEDEAHGGGGEAGVGIQERDDGGHVGAADGDDEHDAEDERDDDHDREEAASASGSRTRMTATTSGDAEEQRRD